MDAKEDPTLFLLALQEELGEVARLFVRQGRKNAPSTEEYEFELADLLIYAAILAEGLGIELESAIREKFNKVSKDNSVPEQFSL